MRKGFSLLFQSVNYSDLSAWFYTINILNSLDILHVFV